MRLIKTSPILLLACSSLQLPPQSHQDAPQTASMPASVPSVTTEQASPSPVSGALRGPLWVLCDPAAPGRGFCVSLEQAREIRIRHQKALARAARAGVDERERREKAEARAEAAAAQGKKDVTVAAIIGGVFSLLMLIVGGAIGAVAF